MSNKDYFVALRKLIAELSANKDVLIVNDRDFTFTLEIAESKADSVTNVLIDDNFDEETIKAKKDSFKCEVDYFKEDLLDYLQLCKETNTVYALVVLIADTNTTFDFVQNHTEVIKIIQENLLDISGMLIFVEDIPGFVMDRYIRPGADKITKKVFKGENSPFQAFAFYN